MVFIAVVTNRTVILNSIEHHHNPSIMLYIQYMTRYTLRNRMKCNFRTCTTPTILRRTHNHHWIWIRPHFRLVSIHRYYHPNHVVLPTWMKTTSHVIAPMTCDGTHRPNHRTTMVLVGNGANGFGRFEKTGISTSNIIIIIIIIIIK